MWLYYQWLGDHRDDAELAKNHAYLLGSFWNSEAVHQLMNDNVHESSDEDLEESMKIVESFDARAALKAVEQPIRKRRHRATVKDAKG